MSRVHLDPWSAVLLSFAMVLSAAASAFVRVCECGLFLFAQWLECVTDGAQLRVGEA